MNRRRAPASTSVPARRWHILPPLVHGPEPLEGGAVLGETPGPLGLLLWQALRDVMLWAESPAADRADLFSPEAAIARDALMAAAVDEDSLRRPLRVLRSMCAAPAAITGPGVAQACEGIAQWAKERGCSATALAFAQNAALANPAAAAPALAVARLADATGDHARAELWYRRATGIARRSRAWRIYARSFSGLGTLYQDRGNLPAAHRYHLRALRGARRGGLRPEQAVALHDLFGVAVEAGRRREAERYAREAFAAYPRHSPQLAALAHDVAYFWMEQGLFARALSVFQAVAPLVHLPEERLWVTADLMRAAAGSGDAELAAHAAAEVRGECSRAEMSAAAARALVEVARGELQLGAWDAAAAAAEDALRFAREHREGRTALAAEALLDAARTRRATEASATRRGTAGDSAGEEVVELATELIRSLSGLGTTENQIEHRITDPKRRTVKASPLPEAHVHG